MSRKVRELPAVIPEPFGVGLGVKSSANLETCWLGFKQGAQRFSFIALRALTTTSPPPTEANTRLVCRCAPPKRVPRAERGGHTQCDGFKVSLAAWRPRISGLQALGNGETPLKEVHLRTSCLAVNSSSSFAVLAQRTRQKRHF